MNKSFIIVAFLLFGFLAGYAQKGDQEISKESNFKDRLYKGGGFILTGNQYGTTIGLSPMVGYMVSSRFSVGVGGTYLYYKSNSFSDSQYGGFVFSRLNLIKQVFAYAEYSIINQTDYRDGISRLQRDRLPVGVGISQPVGSGASVNLVFAYDLLFDSNDSYYKSYSSPWISSVYLSF